MGSGASAPSEMPGTDLHLPSSGLRFTAQQVRSLNSYVDTLYEEDLNARMSVETECAVETLVQRIVDGAGQRDPRFRCCHLIALHRDKKMRSRSLEYLVTLDSLPALNTESDECVLQEGPVGYGKIRLSDREAEKWEEFLTPTGYLCRDKLVERWVELIARCAQSRGGGASRALSARAAVHARPHAYCYLERGEFHTEHLYRVSHQPSPERRLAIVEGASWVLVRVGAGEAEAKLVLAVRGGGVIPSAYSTRVPLTHPLALLHYTAAQGGFYAAAVCPPSSIVSTERAATWQLWHPALEATLDGHCSQDSTMARIAGALNSLVDKMREGCFQGASNQLSRYMAWCAHRKRLEHTASLRGAARFCVAAHSAHHLLRVLDDIHRVCSHGGAAGFVYAHERGALVRRAARDTGWERDAAALRGCLLYLQRLAVNEDIPQSMGCKLESALTVRGSEAGSHARLPVYLARVVRELLASKDMINYKQQNTFRSNLLQATSQHRATEELIHVLAILLDQARDVYLSHVIKSMPGDKELASYRSKKWHKLKEYYDASSACLIDAVRRDPELREELHDDVTLVSAVLRWLQRGAKEDKKYLGPVLKPFLNELQSTAVENSWFLEDFEDKKCLSEFEGLKTFCLGVHEGLNPCNGLLEAAKKFVWAKALVDVVDRYRHFDFRLVFPTGDGLAVSYPIKLNSRREHISRLLLSRRDKAEAKLRLARRCVLAAFNNALVGRPQLKQNSHHGSTEEILTSVKNGNFWRNNTKPDVIPSTSQDSLDLPKVRRRSRRRRPATTYGFPEISITNQSDTKTLRKKYHTLKSLVYKEPVESVKELRERPRSAGSTVRNKDALSRPSILETLDFINSVKDALCVEESSTSDIEDLSWSGEDECVVSQLGSPLNAITSRCGGALHLALGDLTHALLTRGKFTVLQELCSFIPHNEGALFALHRLARAARSRSADRDSNWRLPETEEQSRQTYRARPDAAEERPAPPPRRPEPQPKRYTDFTSTRLQNIQQNMEQLELISSKLSQQRQYTGIINPIYDIKIPKDRFTVKRTKSLGRSFSSRNLGIDITKYNLSLGRNAKNGRNDVITAMDGTSGETGLDVRSALQRNKSVVGDSYRVSRINID